MPREEREEESFGFILDSLGEDASFNSIDLRVVATLVDESAADEMGESVNKIDDIDYNIAVIKETWILEVLKKDFDDNSLNQTAMVSFRGARYKIAGQIETDVRTYKLFLLSV